ncbi:MAG: sugar ABC transporter permease [candidate division WOR-3 bacterium]|nr:MAG: sugar ABC transporter permease [candidate division WOR-3 bacterium]
MNRKIKEPVSFLLPLIFFIAAFLLFPVLGTFWNSLWHDVPFMARRFVAFDNYVGLIKDGQFWQTSFFTIVFACVSVSLEMAFGMITALVLNEKSRLRGALRGIALIPWAIPSVIGARIWQLIFRYDYGVANITLKAIGIGPVNWLGTSVGAFAALVLADVWRTTPFVAIILLAGLQTVPDDILKQAQIDGANIFQRFYRITLPMMKPIIMVAILFRTIDAMRVFDLIYVITGGGPGGTTASLSVYGYKFFLTGDFGYGSAVSVILFIIALTMAVVYIKLGKLRSQ